MKKLLTFMLFVLFFGCEKQHDLPPSPGRMIKDFKLETGQYGNATIYQDGDAFKILVRLVQGTDLTKVVPIFTLSDGANSSPASGEAIDVSTGNTFIFAVTAASGDVRQWEVEFREYDSSISDYDTYSISVNDGSAVMQVQGDLAFNEKYLDNAIVNAATAEAAEGENLKRWQEWDIIYHSSEGGTKYYQLRNLHSGMFLNGASDGGELKQNWELKNNADLQLWRIEESVETGKFELSNKANGLYATLSGDGAILAQTKQSSETQRWAITKLPRDSYRDGDVTNFFSRTTGSVAFDQGTSIPLSDGRVLWVTQDAWYHGSMAPNGNLYGNHFISYTNSIIIQPSIDDWNPNAPMMTRQGASNGGIGNICPIPSGASRNWVGPGVELGDYVYIHGGEGHGLDDTDQAVYKLKKESGNEWNQVERLAIPNMTGQLDIRYKDGMVKSDDGYVYVYGERTAPETFGFNTLLYVARFSHDEPTEWSFWDGSTWGHTPLVTSSSVIAEGNGTNNFGYLNGKFLHLTMDQGFYCGIPSVNMYISTSNSPTGPFTSRKLVYHFTEFYKGYNARIYTPIIHTIAQNDRNELLLTYSINYGACDENSENVVKEDDGNFDPYYYRVKGVRVPYEMIGLQ
jgi:hypothetical protein